MKKISIALFSTSLLALPWFMYAEPVNNSTLDDKAQRAETESSQSYVIAFKCEPFPECIIWPDSADEARSTTKNKAESEKSEEE